MNTFTNGQPIFYLYQNHIHNGNYIGDNWMKSSAVFIYSQTMDMVQTVDISGLFLDRQEALVVQQKRMLLDKIQGLTEEIDKAKVDIEKYTKELEELKCRR